MKGLYQKKRKIGIVVAFLVFGAFAGYMGGVWRGFPPPVTLERHVAQSEKNTEQIFIASVHGSTYYLATCGGAGRIHEANKLYFSSREEAEAQGYRPASTCREIFLFP